MAEQLTLMEPPKVEWRLDGETREAGRRGIAEARRLLRDRAGGPGRRPPSRPRAA